MEIRERIENNEDLTLIPEAIHSNKRIGIELYIVNPLED